MKNRKRQRENRKMKNKQEMLDIRNSTGVLDPTPYHAVLRMRDGISFTKNREGRNFSDKAS